MASVPVVVMSFTMCFTIFVNEFGLGRAQGTENETVWKICPSHVCMKKRRTTWRGMFHDTHSTGTGMFVFHDTVVCV